MADRTLAVEIPGRQFLATVQALVVGSPFIPQVFGTSLGGVIAVLSAFSALPVARYRWGFTAAGALTFFHPLPV